MSTYYNSLYRAGEPVTICSNGALTQEHLTFDGQVASFIVGSSLPTTQPEYV